MTRPACEGSDGYSGVDGICSPLCLEEPSPAVYVIRAGLQVDMASVLYQEPMLPGLLKAFSPCLTRASTPRQEAITHFAGPERTAAGYRGKPWSLVPMGPGLRRSVGRARSYRSREA